MLVVGNLLSMPQPYRTIERTTQSYPSCSTVEVFAYGAGDYDTRQEFLVLGRYLDIVGPDVMF